MTAVHAEDNQTDEQIAHDTNVTVPDKMWKENLSDIEVSLPENADGNLSVRINNQTIYNNYTQEKSLKIPIVLPKDIYPILYVTAWPPESRTYRISAFYNDVQINMTDEFTVMDHNQSYDYRFTPREILQYGDYEYQVLMFPSTTSGYIDVYVDNKFYKRINATRFTIIEGLNNLTLGSHELRIDYSGDDYFYPTNKTYQFNVTDVIINIPTNLVLDHDDCVSVRVLKTAKCTVEIYVDGKLFKKGKTDEYGDYLLSLFDLSCTTHEVEVKVTGKYSKTLKKTVNVTYYIDADSQKYIYGPDNTYLIFLPEDLKPELLNITIGGIRFTDFEMGSSYADVNISCLKKGNHTVFIEYMGDEKYYRYNLSTYVVVDYEVVCPYYIAGFDTVCYLYLPSEAKGNLTLLVNGEVYKAVPMKNGYAQISLEGLVPGEYDFELFYDGDDFEVKNDTASVEIHPELYYTSDIDAGESVKLTFVASTNTKGYLLFDVNDKIYNVTIKNGKASLVLKDLPLGQNYISVDYIGDDGFNTTLYAFIYVFHTTPKIKASNVNVYATQKAKYKFSVTGTDAKPLKNKYVKVKIAKKTYKVKTNSKGVATMALPKLKAGKYTIKITYGDGKATKRMTVKHIVSLKTVKVKKSARRLVLTAKLAKKLKGKKITFKFNGKTYRAKTNAKGIAKLTIKKSVLSKLRVGKRVYYSASYLKDTVKKSVKVRR